jgi:hypothetical protein
MSDSTGGKIIVRITPPLGGMNYNVGNDLDYLEVDTSSGGVANIFLQKISIADARKPIYISDVGNNASIGNIRINATGGNLINNALFISLEVNGIVAEVNIADTNRFIANLSTDDTTPPTPGDKNFVLQQMVASTIWSVPHNLNKKCAVQVVDNSLDEIMGKVHWVNNNEVEIRFNKPKTGWVYCN